MSQLNVILVIAGIFAVIAIGWLGTGTLIPYQAIRNGIYAVSAFLAVFALSIVASYWIDIGSHEFRKLRELTDLKKRCVLALILIGFACCIMRTWEVQENRELEEAKTAYKLGQYATATELFKQQRDRYWTTDDMYQKVTGAIVAAEEGKKLSELREQVATISPNDKKHEEMQNLIDQKITNQEINYPKKWGKTR